MRAEVLYKLFLDFSKAYNALNREPCMDILAGCGFSLKKERILCYYWDHLSMVSRSGGYYITPFKGHQGVTHRYPLSTTIFNMLVDAVIRHWVALMSGYEAGPGGFGWSIQWMAEFFYTDGNLLASPRPACIQVVMDVLTVLFDRVCLQTNVENTFGVVCQPCYIVGRKSETSYMRRMTAVGISFWKQKR